MNTPTLAYIHAEIDAAAYWAAVSAQLSFSEFCGGTLIWEEKLIESVHEGFWRLNSLDRSSPFWSRTNGLATESKLCGFAEFELSKNPRDTEAARLAIAMGLLHGSGHLEVAPWRALVQTEAADFGFLVFSAFATAPYWSDANVGKVSTLTRSLHIQTEVQSALQSLASRGQEEALWVKYVKHELSA